jgi:hypothetical protein
MWVPKQLMKQHKHNHVDICEYSWTSIMRKAMLFWVTLSLMMKHGFTTMSQRASVKVLNGYTWLPCQKKVLISTNSGANNAHSILWFIGTSTVALARKGCVHKQCRFLNCCVTSFLLSLLFTNRLGSLQGSHLIQWDALHGWGRTTVAPATPHPLIHDLGSWKGYP